MATDPCCGRGFQWSGTPVGRTGTLATNQTYITGSDPHSAILLVADLFGWTFANIRLLADHLASEAGATVYVPDFFNGEVLPVEPLIDGRLEAIDLPGFVGRNSREIREPEIFACARALRGDLGYAKVGAVGYCYGGWACARLGAREHEAAGRLVDCIVLAHPSLLTERDIDEIAVPTQVLAPEIDFAYSAELKLHTFQQLQKNGVTFEYRHFPGVEHACFIRGDERKEGEREAMARGKDAAVGWFRQYLKG